MSLDPAFLSDSFPHVFAACMAACSALLPSLSREEASFSVRSSVCAKRESVAPLPQSKRREVATLVKQLESQFFSPREQEFWRYYSNVASEKPFLDVQPAPPNMGSPRVLWEYHNEALLAYLQHFERNSAGKHLVARDETSNVWSDFSPRDDSDDPLLTALAPDDIPAVPSFPGRFIRWAFHGRMTQSVVAGLPERRNRVLFGAASHGERNARSGERFVYTWRGDLQWAFPAVLR